MVGSKWSVETHIQTYMFDGNPQRRSNWREKDKKLDSGGKSQGVKGSDGEGRTRQPGSSLRCT